MGEKGNLTEDGRLPGLPRSGSTATGEASFGKQPGADWSAKAPGDGAFGKAAEAGWGKGHDGWAAQPGAPVGPSVPPPGMPPGPPPPGQPQGPPPPGAPPIGGFLVGRRDDEQPPHPGSAHPPPRPPGS
jgi:hypothetical protein